MEIRELIGLAPATDEQAVRIEELWPGLWKARGKSPKELAKYLLECKGAHDPRQLGREDAATLIKLIEQKTEEAKADPSAPGAAPGGNNSALSEHRVSVEGLLSLASIWALREGRNNGGFKLAQQLRDNRYSGTPRLRRKRFSCNTRHGSHQQTRKGKSNPTPTMMRWPRSGPPTRRRRASHGARRRTGILPHVSSIGTQQWKLYRNPLVTDAKSCRRPIRPPERLPQFFLRSQGGIALNARARKSASRAEILGVSRRRSTFRCSRWVSQHEWGLAAAGIAWAEDSS